MLNSRTCAPNKKRKGFTMGLFDKENAKTNQATPVETPAVTTAVETPAVADATPVKELKDAKGKAVRDAINAIAEYAKEHEAELPKEIVENAKILRPSVFGLGGNGGFVKAEYRAWQSKLMQILNVKSFDEIKVGAKFDEMAVFMAIKAGRREMRQICIDLIKTPGEKPAIYVKFDADKAEYTVAGIGEEPKDWDGYKPQAK